MRYATLAALTTLASLVACSGGGSDGATPKPCSGGGCVVAISASRSVGNSCALLEGGKVKCWGTNSYGELGTGTTQASLVPVSVVSLAGASAIAVGEWNGCAVVAGSAWCWGSDDGTLWGGTIGQVLVPTRLPGPGFVGATEVSVGQGHACATLRHGEVMCLGVNDCGQVGNTGSYYLDPVAVPSVAGATAVAAGKEHTCVVIGGGAVKCWGASGPGQNSSDSVEVPSLTGATAIAAGDRFTCALLGSGSVKCWGGNYEGQLGAPTTAWLTPDPVTVASVTGATSIAAGTAHACAVVTDGAVKCWGYNQHGQLGNGDIAGAVANGTGWLPEQVPGLTGVTAISAGASHTCALVRGQGVKCWGANDYGQLGDGTTTERHTPVEVVF
jgi:alpha-tubulin suppressor-like RCC1 family protein